MPDRFAVDVLENSASQSTGQLVDPERIQQIRNSFVRFLAVECASSSDATSVAAFEDMRYWEEAERIAPSNEELRASVVRFPAPQEWLEEDDQLF